MANLPEFMSARKARMLAHFYEGPSRKYGMIMGLDVLQCLGTNFLFSSLNLMIEWDSIHIPMRAADREAQELQATNSAMNKIKAASYKVITIPKFVYLLENLDSRQKFSLLSVLQKNKQLFDLVLTVADKPPADIELKQSAKLPWGPRPFSIPKAFESSVKIKKSCLEDLKVLKQVPLQTFALPTFIIPRESNEPWVVTDFCAHNRLVERKLYPLLTINYLCHWIQYFMWASSIDLNMGYHHIPLLNKAPSLCVTILTCGCYEYQQFPQGLVILTDDFQGTMATFSTTCPLC